MRGSLWLITAVLLLGSIVANKKYEELSEEMRRIVDKAISQANEEHEQKYHVDYSDIIKTNKVISMVHVLLKTTFCEKSSDRLTHRTDCSITGEGRPWISCVACGKAMYCLPFKYLQEIKENVKCNRKTAKSIKSLKSSVQYTGGGHTMFSQGNTDETEHEAGCLGCI